jgi:hypothetical protein
MPNESLNKQERRGQGFLTRKEEHLFQPKFALKNRSADKPMLCLKTRNGRARFARPFLQVSTAV